MSEVSKPHVSDDYAQRVADLFKLREEVENALLDRLENIGSTEKDAAEALGAMQKIWLLIEAVSDIITNLAKEDPASRDKLGKVIGGFHAIIEMSLVVGMHMAVTDTAKILEKHSKADKMRSVKEKKDKTRLDKCEIALREFIGNRSIEKHAAFAESIFSAPIDSKGGLADLNRIAAKHGAPPFKRSTTKTLLRKMWLETSKLDSTG